MLPDAVVRFFESLDEPLGQPRPELHAALVLSPVRNRSHGSKHPASTPLLQPAYQRMVHVALGDHRPETGDQIAILVRAVNTQEQLIPLRRGYRKLKFLKPVRAQILPHGLGHLEQRRPVPLRKRAGDVLVIDDRPHRERNSRGTVADLALDELRDCLGPYILPVLQRFHDDHREKRGEADQQRLDEHEHRKKGDLEAKPGWHMHSLTLFSAARRVTLSFRIFGNLRNFAENTCGNAPTP